MSEEYVQDLIKKIDNLDDIDMSMLPQSDVQNYIGIFQTLLNSYPFLHKYWGKYAKFTFKTTNSSDAAIEIMNEALLPGKLYYSIDAWQEYIDTVTYLVENGAEIKNMGTDPIRTSYAFALDSIGWHFHSSDLWKRAINYEIQNGRSPLFYQFKSLMYPTVLIKTIGNDIRKSILATPSEILETYDYDISIHEFILHDPILLVEGIYRDNSEVRQNLNTQVTTKIEETKQKVRDIFVYELQITRQYFAFTSLDEVQISIWESYIQYVLQNYSKDHSKEKRTCVINTLERALIPCALVDSIWLYYTDFLESEGLINEAREVYGRIPENCLRGIVHAAVFEEVHDNDRATQIYNAMAESVYVEHIIATSYYILRTKGLNDTISFLNSSRTRLVSIGDRIGAGVISDTINQIQRANSQSICYEENPKSAIQISSESAKSDKDTANQYLFAGAYGGGLNLNERACMRRLYLSFVQMNGVDAGFQLSTELDARADESLLVASRYATDQAALAAGKSATQRNEEWLGILESITSE